MTPGGIAILSTCGGILVALLGVCIELYKGRKAQATVVHAVQPNTGGSLRDAVNRIETAVATLDGKVDGQAERLARVETRLDYTTPTSRRNSDL